jgi:hypothetical protein
MIDPTFESRLLCAVFEKNLAKVLALLQLEEYPYHPKAEALLHALLGYTKEDLELAAIIRALLDYYADYLESEITSTKCSNESVLQHLALAKGDSHIESIRILLEHSKQQEILDCIDLASVTTLDNLGILNLLLDYGIVRSAKEAFNDLITELPSIHRNRHLACYSALLRIFNILQTEENWPLLPPKIVRNFFMFVVEVHDFEFACKLLLHYHIQDLNEPPDMLSVMLKMPEQVVNIDFENLLVLWVMIQHESFRRQLSWVNISIKQGLNKSSLELAKKIYIIFNNAVIYLLNPFQPTFHPSLSLMARLKIALFYLKNELKMEMNELSDTRLEELLLNRMIEYVFKSYRKRIVNFYQLYWQQKYPLSSFNRDLAVLSNFCSNYADYLVYSENRSILYHYLKQYIDSAIPTEQTGLSLEKILGLWRLTVTYSNKNFPTATNTFLEYALIYGIEHQDQLILSQALLQPKIKIMTEDYQKLSNLSDYLLSDDNPFKKYFKGMNSWFDTICIDILLQFDKLEACLKQIGTNKSRTFLIDSLLDYRDINEKEYTTLLLILKKGLDKKLYSVMTEVMRLLLKYGNKSRNKSWIDILALLAKTNNANLIPFTLQIAIETKSIDLKVFFEILSRLFNKKTLQRYMRNSSDLTGEHDLPSTHVKIELSPKNRMQLYKLAIIKKMHKSIARQLNPGSAERVSLDSLARQNYHNLICSLRSAPINDKGTDFFGKDNILTRAEIPLYASMLDMKWKVTHRIKDRTSFLKIKQDQEIRSGWLLNAGGEIVTPQPIGFGLSGFVFFTIGPGKSPVPPFLAHACSIEMDLADLLKKIPSFLANAHISSHWYAFDTNQTLTPITLMGTTVEVSHDKHYQSVRVYKGNQLNCETEYHDKSAIFFSGKRLLHILTLLFIKKIRTIGGQLYQKLLSEPNNEDLIATTFAHLFHPGIFELRYPYALPLDDSYTQYFDSSSAFFSQVEVNRLLNDFNYLKKSVDDGRIYYQKLPISITAKAKTFHGLGNLLTQAILSKDKAMVDYLMTRWDFLPEKNHPVFLSPLEAAILIDDKEFAMQLLVKGFPILGLSDSYYHLPFTDIVRNYLNDLTVEDCLLLAQTANRKISNELLVSITQRLTLDENENLPLVQIMEILLNRGATAYLLNTKHSVIKFAVKARCEQAIILLLRYSFQTTVEARNKLYSILEGDLFSYCVFNELEYLIPKVAFLLNEYRQFNKVDLLCLFLAGFSELFVDYFVEIFGKEYPEISEARNIRGILFVLVESLYKEKNHFLKEFLRDVVDEPWVLKIHSSLFQNILIEDQFIPYMKDLFGKKTITRVLQFKFINLMDSLQFLIHYQFENLLVLITAAFKSRIKDSVAEEISQALEFINQKGIDYHKIIFELPELGQFTDYSIFIERLLLRANQINYYQYDRYTKFLTQSEQILQIFDAYLKGRLNLSLLCSWLVQVINEDLTKQFILKNVASFITTNLKDCIDQILREISLSDYPKKMRQRALFFINYLFGVINVENFSLEDELWGHINIMAPVPVRYYDVPRFSKQLKSQIDFKHFLDIRFSESLPKSDSVVAFITTLIDNEVYVYLGRKRPSQTGTFFLLAPGGFAKEDPIKDLQREVLEETHFEIKLPTNCSDMSRESFSGEIIFSEAAAENNIPNKIVLLHELTSADNYNRLHTMRRRCTHFFWVDYQYDVSKQFSSGDDFTEGTWIPLTGIYCKDHEYYYQAQPILPSNGLLLDLIKGETISHTNLSKTLLLEAKNKFSTQNLADRFFNGIKFSTKRTNQDTETFQQNKRQKGERVEKEGEKEEPESMVSLDKKITHQKRPGSPQKCPRPYKKNKYQFWDRVDSSDVTKPLVPYDGLDEVKPNSGN